ncbi:MAG: 50S ribosomal protein L3 N(5)-glutamine methyltransferase [Rhodocyclales bacterium]|nr:50S ribosomal protein L3 N(5)-glutamine methyltransferase [Rhodocyclales bacterium]
MIHGATDELVTIRDWLRWAVSRFDEAGLHYGHGTDNAWDEAVWIVLATLHLPRDTLEPFLDARLTSSERQTLLERLQQRVVHRLPAAYLLNEAWLGDFRFHVDPRVIVPRSYFAELLEDGFAPWIEAPEAVVSALDLCTGSGCLAIVMAHAFPNAIVDAIDISAQALDVARHNIAAYGLENRVRAIESDLFAKARGRRYELIICNPPYVTAEAMDALPIEYRHEPALALAAGADGLDVVRRILAQAHKHLKPGGVIAIEVGHNQDLVTEAFPDLPAVWLDTANAEGKVFVLTREDFPA